MPGFDGIAILICVAGCLVLGLAVDVAIAASYGWSLWLIAPPVFAMYVGHRVADYLGR